MGYIQDIGKEFENRLGTLEAECQDGGIEECDKQRMALIKFFKDKILESYKNGLKAGKGEGDSSTPRAPRKPARNYQK